MSSTASSRSWRNVQPKMIVWVTAAIATPDQEASIGPTPSQSVIFGLFG